MKKWVVSVTFMFFFVCSFGLLAQAAVKKHKNPVHDKRKAAYEKRRELYKGQQIIEVPKEKKKDEAKDSGEDVSAEDGKIAEKKERQYANPQLAELMKAFDKDDDGVISYQEMDAAQAAGKGQELKTLLANEKAQEDRKKAKGKSKSAKKESGK